MSLAEEYGLVIDGILTTRRLNDIVSQRIDEAAAADSIASTNSLQQVLVDEVPASDDFRNKFSQAITSNHNIHTVTLMTQDAVSLPELIRWIASPQALVHMTSLQKVVMYDLFSTVGLSLQDWDFMLSLLITSPSLQELDLVLGSVCVDAFNRTFPRFLSDASTLLSFSLTILSVSSLPEDFFTSLFESVAQSSLQKFEFYGGSHYTEAVGQAGVECFARAISESALQQVGMGMQMRLDLSRTLATRNLDFALSQVGHERNLLFNISRRWKPLLDTSIPLGLWPFILEKAHLTPETCIHGPYGILFCLLRAKPDLISGASCRKRKRAVS